MRFTLLAALLALTSLPARAAQPVELSEEEWKMFRHYQRAMADPQVEKIAPEKRMRAIAKDAGYKQKELEQAVARGEAAGDVKAKCESNLKELLSSSDLGGQVRSIEVDTEAPHAVAYVAWNNQALPQLEEEASLIAARAAEACPVISSLQLWAQDAQSPKNRVFQALISRSAAQKIQPARVKDFADTRFIRLFENVKSVAKGDDLSAEQNASGGATGGTGTSGQK